MDETPQINPARVGLFRTRGSIRLGVTLSIGCTVASLKDGPQPSRLAT